MLFLNIQSTSLKITHFFPAKSEKRLLVKHFRGPSSSKATKHSTNNNKNLETSKLPIREPVDLLMPPVAESFESHGGKFVIRVYLFCPACNDNYIINWLISKSKIRSTPNRTPLSGFQIGNVRLPMISRPSVVVNRKTRGK